MIPLLLTVVAALSAVAYVVTPLRRPPPATPDGSVDTLRERQEAAVLALRELDYEHSIGKLADTEYFPLRDRYARQAMTLLKQLDQREQGRDEALERAIGQRRQVLRTTPAAATASRRQRSVTRLHPAVLPGAAAGILVIALALLAVMVHTGNAPATPIAVLQLSAPRALAVAPSSSQLLAAGASGLLRSQDGGVTWQPVANPPLPGSIVSLAPDPAGSGVYALVATGNQSTSLWLSPDGGQTWSAVTPAPLLPAGASALAFATSGGTPYLYVATAQGVSASADQGKTWVATNGSVNGLLSARVSGLAYAPTADQAAGPNGSVWHGLLYAATVQGLYRSRDGGQSWFVAPLGGQLVAVASDFKAPSTVYALDVGGRLFKSTDGGETWGR
jgi:photosystem II stability/assembly factor-like uncharacterized protein